MLRGRAKLVTIGVLSTVLIFFWWAQSDRKSDVAKSVNAGGEESIETIVTKPSLPPLKEIPANSKLGEPGVSRAKDEFERLWNFVYVQQYECKDTKMVGGRTNPPDNDGSYAVCMEPYFRPKTSSNRCLVYSFGIGRDFSFDDAMATSGCEVHSFDPSIDVEDGLVRESGVTFHKIGISKQDLDRNSNGWKMRTLSTILRELGHQGRYLDYLKVDTDNPNGGGFEHETMQELLDTGLFKCVRQFGLEVHLTGPIITPKWLNRCRTLYRQMTQLSKNGYRLISTNDNVRFDRIMTKNPNFSQSEKKAIIVEQYSVILWEMVFVNFDPVPCKL